MNATRKLINVVGAVGVAALLAACGGDDDDTEASKDVQVDSEWQSPPDTPTDRACESEEAPDEGCAVFRNTSTYTGTLDGQSEYTTEGWADGGGQRFVTVETFTGSVDGCGEGTLEWRVEGTVADETIDGAWTIASASGGLADAHGSGTLDATFADDLSYAGTMEGTITCRA